MSSEQKIAKLFSSADIEINGKDPWDISVNNPDLFPRVLSGGSLALGESYIDGWWDTAKLDEFFYRILRAGLDKKAYTLSMLPAYLQAKLVNKGRRSKAFEIGEKHYDTGNDLFAAMLDSSMTYTCGYWKNIDRIPENLDPAQEQKLDLVCRKIGLKKGDTVLDIGCGWGSFMKFAAEKYGANVTGITVSKEQVELGREICRGLPVKFKLEDYRDHHGSYDHIVSLGMVEHVGDKNYRTFFKAARRLLKENGLFLLHTIGHNRKTSGSDPWIEKYIFPNGIIPQSSKLVKTFEGLFVMEDWHNFGPDYDSTLLAWHDRFEKAWPQLSQVTDNNGEKKYSNRFYRMWRYYLLACAGAFRARNIHVWQIVLSTNGIHGGYVPIR